MFRSRPARRSGHNAEHRPDHHPDARSGFTLIESLVALAVLAVGLALGLGAVLQGRFAFDLLALQSELDATLDRSHEALRGRLIDVEQAARHGQTFVDPDTFEQSVLPAEQQLADPSTDLLTLRVEPTALDDLFEVTLAARSSRGRLTRLRSLHTQVYEPGLTDRLASP